MSIPCNLNVCLQVVSYIEILDFFVFGAFMRALESLIVQYCQSILLALESLHA